MTSVNDHRRVIIVNPYNAEVRLDGNYVASVHSVYQRQEYRWSDQLDPRQALSRGINRSHISAHKIGKRIEELDRVQETS